MIEAIRAIFEVDASDGIFGGPGWLLFLALVPLLAAVALLTGWRHGRVLARLFSGAVLRQVRPPGVVVRRTIRDVLSITAITLVIVSLAGPRCDKRVQLVKATGVDMVVVVDLSRSMDAADVDPSRLERARREVYDLLDVLEGDRVGLVVFAGGAYPRMPLSEDHEALRMLVTEMSTNDFQAQGSAMDLALKTAADLLEKDKESRAGKAILVLSDGELHDVPTALTAAAEVRDRGVRVYAMGIGEAPAPIPLSNGNWQLDRGGRQVLTTPSPDTLRDIARLGGGAFADSTPGASDIQQLYRREIRGAVEAGLRATRPKITWTPMWGWPLGVAVVLGLIAGWLGEGRVSSWGGAAGLLLVGLVLAPTEAWASSLAEGDQAFRAGRYPDAVRIFTELTSEDPDDPELLGRLGAARYRAGDFEGAARAFERQAELEGRQRPESLYNAGNAHARAGRLEEALRRYDEVLALDEHAGAARNREIVQGDLERRRQERPPEEPQPQQQQQQGSGQDKEKQDASQNQQPQGGAPQPGEGKPDSEPPEKKENPPTPPSSPGEQQPGGGTENGPREMSQREQSGDNPTQQSGGRKQTSENQERLDDSEVGAVDPGELATDDPGGTPAGSAPGDARGQPAGETSDAERMLEGVREGRPRITIPGRGTDKPW